MDLSCRTLLVVSKKIDTLQFPNNTLPINTFWWINSLTSPYIYTSTMRSSIKNRFCDLKKKEASFASRFDLLLDKHARNEPTFAMRVLFYLVKRRKFWEKKKEKKWTTQKVHLKRTDFIINFIFYKNRYKLIKFHSLLLRKKK